MRLSDEQVSKARGNLGTCEPDATCRGHGCVNGPRCGDPDCKAPSCRANRPWYLKPVRFILGRR